MEKTKMQMKKIMLFMCALLLVGCGNNAREGEVYKEANQGDLSSRDDSEKETMFTENDSSDMQYANENISEYDVRHISCSFNSEVTWATSYNRDDQDIYYLLIKGNGEIVKKYNEKDIDVKSDFCDNLSMVKFPGMESGVNAIIDADGSDISSNFVGENEKIYDFTIEDTSAVVWTIATEETFETYNVRLTAKNANGEEVNSWGQDTFSIDLLKKPLFYYVGDSKYCICSYGNQNEKYIIDLQSDNVFSVPNPVFITAANNLIFVDGVCYTANGEVKCDHSESMEQKISSLNIRNSDLIAYIDGNMKFCNLEGEIQFESDKSLYNHSGYDAGCAYALATLRNDGGTCYTSIMDKNGNLIFEPIMGEIDDMNVSRQLLIRYNCFLLDNGTSIDLIDKEGQVLSSFDSDATNWAVMDNRLLFSDSEDGKMNFYLFDN